ncbi:hypothetical protein KYY02_04595 [Streptomyces pimonensis]|uniref:Uncharacterized protein n=1 Tax=Streptomyces pimonensis TaxID=2860288 RepID=A0ABV4ITL5_9ACTN
MAAGALVLLGAPASRGTGSGTADSSPQPSAFAARTTGNSPRGAVPGDATGSAHDRSPTAAGPADRSASRRRTAEPSAAAVASGV